MNFLDKYFNELIDDDDLPDKANEETNIKISKPEPSFSINKQETGNDVLKAATLSTPNGKSNQLFFSPSNDVTFGPIIPQSDSNSYITSTPTTSYDDFYVNFNINMGNADPVSTEPELNLLSEPCVPSPHPYSPLVISSSSSTVSAPSPRPLSPGDENVINPLGEDEAKKIDVTIDGKTIKMDAETLLGEYDVITASPIFAADGLMNIVPIDEAKTEYICQSDRNVGVSGTKRHLPVQSLPMNSNNKLNMNAEMVAACKSANKIPRKSDDPIDFEFDTQMSPSLPAPAPYHQPVTLPSPFMTGSQIHHLPPLNQPDMSGPHPYYCYQPSVSALHQLNSCSVSDPLASNIYYGSAPVSSTSSVVQSHGISLGPIVYPADPASSKKTVQNIALSSTKQTIKRIYVNYPDPADTNPAIQISTSKSSSQSVPYTCTSEVLNDTTHSPPQAAGPSLEHDSKDDLFPPRPIPSYMKEPLPSPKRFKTDITKFFSRQPCDASSHLNLGQTGQNVIPLPSTRRPEEQMWFVEGEAGRFRNVPVVKQIKRGRGRPKGKSEKVKMRMRETMSKILSRNHGKVCARCVELYQKISFNSMLKNDETHLICEDCGNFISKEPVKKNSHIFVKTGLENQTRVAAAPPVEHLDEEEEDDHLTEPSNEEIKAGTKIVVDGSTIINITKPRRKKIEIMYCWNCHGTSSMGPWHRHKTTPNKFLCDFCLNFFKRRNSVQFNA